MRLKNPLEMPIGTWGAWSETWQGYGAEVNYNFVPALRAAGLPAGTYQVGWEWLETYPNNVYAVRGWKQVDFNLPAPAPDVVLPVSKTGLNSPESYRSHLYSVLIAGIGAAVFAYMWHGAGRRSNQ